MVIPEVRSVGANIDGISGMAIDRTSNVAIAMINNYGDIQDLYIETLDPKNSIELIASIKKVSMVCLNWSFPRYFIFKSEDRKFVDTICGIRRSL